MNLTTGLQSEAIKASLAEMDRKLRELQQELEPSPRIGRDGDRAPRASQAPAPASAQNTLRPAVVPYAGIPGSPDAIINEAQATARGILDNAVTQLGAVKGQIDQLLHLRDYLGESIRGLLADCEQGLRQVEAGLPPGILAASHSPAAANPTPGTGPPSVPAPAPPAYASDTSTQPALLRLTAGPFQDVAAVGALEQALGRVSGIERVTVQGFEESSAVMEVSLSANVDLVGELERALPFRFELISRDATSVALRVVHPAGRSEEQLSPSTPTGR